MISRQACGVDGQAVRRPDTSGSKQQHLGPYMTAIGERCLDVAIAGFDLFDLRAEAQIDTIFANLMSEILNDRAVDEIEECVAWFNQSHPHI